MKFPCCFFLLSILLTARGVNVDKNELAVEYFCSKTVAVVTSTLCRKIDSNVFLNKKFSEKGISFNWLDLRRFKEKEVVERLRSKTSKLGVILDLECPKSLELLQVANRNNLLTFSLIFWLVITEPGVSHKTLKTLVETYEPEANDPLKFLMAPYEDRRKEKYLMDINRKVNREFFEDVQTVNESKSKYSYLEDTTKVRDLLKMKIFPDNKIILAVPETRRDKVSYNLFTVSKSTVDSRPKIAKVGEVRERDKNKVYLKLQEKKEKLNLEHGLLLAGSTVFEPESFTAMDDLATREADLWSKMSLPHVRLLADEFNFRIVIRFYDDYGWQTNGTFGHLMGLLQKKKADLSAAGLLMRSDRFGIVDFLVCPFRLQTGVLFREPSLSSVSNIFILPFSRAIWISIAGVIFLTVLVLRCRAVAGRKLIPSDRSIASFFDIGGYIMGVMCQQGFSTAPKSISARTSILILLLTSVALFTSYSACIVALLQSSSSAILSINDITKSDLEVGIQANFPLYKVIIKEASHPVLKEFYNRKVLNRGEKAFCERRQGIERMRTGMFAFEVELTAGYKLISETYEEREKCGIKEIDLIPKPFICIAVCKDSPYREMFTQRLVWQTETGLFDRTWKLWVDQKPKCEVGRIGFISVGLTEFKPALQLFAYGIVASSVILIAELFYKRKHIISIRKLLKVKW